MAASHAGGRRVIGNGSHPTINHPASHPHNDNDSLERQEATTRGRRRRRSRRRCHALIWRRRRRRGDPAHPKAQEVEQRPAAQRLHVGGRGQRQDQVQVHGLLEVLQPEVHLTPACSASASGKICSSSLRTMRTSVQEDGSPEGSHEEDPQDGLDLAKVVEQLELGGLRKRGRRRKFTPDSARISCRRSRGLDGLDTASRIKPGRNRGGKLTKYLDKRYLKLLSNLTKICFFTIVIFCVPKLKTDDILLQKENL